MKLFFSVGEPSGDLHGSNLIAELRAAEPGLRCIGFGGPKMAAAGLQPIEDLTKHAVMGFLPVIQKIGTFRRLVAEADAVLAKERPDAVVLIDFPGFNWHVAAKARERGIPVYYYGAPQIWAWASWRVAKMRRLVDHVLCKLPFEESWYRERGVAATYVGHPFFDETSRRKVDEALVAELSNAPRPLVALLPGSRDQEVKKNLPDLLRTANKIRAAGVDARFVVAAFKDAHAERAREMVARELPDAVVYSAKTPEIIRAAKTVLACSGSVSLELMAERKPTVISYRVSRTLYWACRTFLVNVKYCTLVNLLADPNPWVERRVPYEPDAPGAENVPYPEYATHRDRTDDMAKHLVRWLTDEAEYNRRVAMLDDLAERYARPGASIRAAAFLLDRLSDLYRRPVRNAA
jgi:lipid-A-disaccharide synthase